MNCSKIKELLSEYVDEVLDVKTKALVDEHLSTCKDCQQELASLKALVNELGSLESVAPPSDFLHQIHERMEQRSWFPKILRTLFAPMRVKIPLEFAGAVAMAILVFFLVHIQRDQYKMAEAPMSLKQEKVAEKGALDSLAKGLKDEVYKPKLAHKTATAEKPSERKETIELALTIKRALPSETYAPEAAMEAAPAPKKRIKRSLAKRKAVSSAKPETDKSDDDFLPKLTRVVEIAGGKVVSIEYTKVSKRPESIHAEIPAGHFHTLYNRLKELGDLQGTPKSVTKKDQGVLLVRIRLLSSSK
jgi:hypothetical protein